MTRPSVSWRADGRAVLNYYHQGERKQHRLPPQVRTEKDADRYVAAFLAALAPVTKASQTTLSQLAEKWWALRDSSKRLAPATKKQSRYAIQTHVLPSLGDMVVGDISIPALRGWLRDLCSGESQPSTVRNAYFTFVALVDDAMAEGWVDWPTNPVKHPAVKKELPKLSSRRNIKYLSIHQIEQLCTSEKIPVARRVRYLLAVCTGLRDGEIAGLSWSQIHPDRVDVVCALALRSEKKGVGFRPPKTETSIRSVPLHPLLAEVLSIWRKGQDSGPVFASAAGRFYRPKSSPLIQTDLESLGFDSESFTFHATRRTFATQLAAKGVSENTIGLLMGHAPEGVTVAHYTAPQFVLLKLAIASLEFGFKATDVVTSISSA